jgi:hypothetical protein
MALPLYIYVEIDNNLYAVQSETYKMDWQRAYSSQLAGNIVRLNFIDRGPGVRVFNAILYLATWPEDSLPYLAGITETWDVQLQNLENSYALTATPLQFQDPLGREVTNLVYFTDYILTYPVYSTPNTPICLATVELTENLQVVNNQ